MFDLFSKKPKEDPRKITANEFINIRDIIGNYLYTRDGYVFMYIRLQPISVDLLSSREKDSLINSLTAELPARPGRSSSLPSHRPWT